MALTVNSAGDWLAGTYGLERRLGHGGGYYPRRWRGARRGGARTCAPRLAPRTSSYTSLVTRENKLAPEAPHARVGRAGFGADDQSALGLPALPERAGRRRGAHDLVAGAGRAVQPERRADPEGPGVLRRVRRPRHRLLRQGAAPAPAADSRAGPRRPRRDHGGRQPRPRARRLRRVPRRRVRDRRAVRHAEGEDRAALARRRAHPRHQGLQEDREARERRHRRDCRAGRRRPGGRQHRRRPPA